MKPVALILIVCIQTVSYGQQVVDTASTGVKPDSSFGSGHVGRITITSEPSGAEVFEDTLFLGVTPINGLPAEEGLHVLKLFYPSARSWNAQCATDSIQITPSVSSSRFVSFGLRTSNGMFSHEVQSRGPDQNAFTNVSENSAIRLQVGYIAGGTMILSGALSAYLKTNSDNKFNAYVANRDPSLLNKVHQLDRWAGVSLFVSEISFGVLIYLLLSD